MPQKNPWVPFLRILSIMIWLASALWLIIQPGFEPLNAFLGAIMGTITLIIAEAVARNSPTSNTDNESTRLTVENSGTQDYALPPQFANLQDFDQPTFSDLTILRPIPTFPPSANKPFIGRNVWLEYLESRFFPFDGSHPAIVVGIRGLPGIGKSVLAYKFARNMHEKGYFSEGCIVLEVKSHDNTETLAAKCAAAIGVKLDNNPYLTPSQIMQKYIQHKDMLIILDGVPPRFSIIELVPGEGSCRLIVTTSDDAVLVNAGISPEESTIRLEPLHQTEAINLLASYIGNIRINSDEASAERIVRLAGGLPLTVEIIGKNLGIRKAISLKEFATDLEERILELSDNDERSTRAALDATIGKFEEEEIQFFAMLGACDQGGFSLQTALETVGMIQNPAAGKESLSKLERFALITIDEDDHEWFEMHSLIHSYARYLAQNRILLTHMNNSKYFKMRRNLLEIAEANHTQGFMMRLAYSINTEARAALSREIAAVISSVDIYLRRNALGDDIILALENLLQQEGLWNKALQITKRSNQVALQRRQLKRAVSARIWTAHVLRRMGRSQEAVSEARTAIGYCESIQWKTMLIFARAADILLKLIGRSPERPKENTYLGLRARVLHTLGDILMDTTNNFQLPLTYLEQALALEERLANKFGQKVILNSMVNLYLIQGKTSEALKLVSKMSALAGSDPYSNTSILNTIGRIYLENDDPERALVVATY